MSSASFVPAAGAIEPGCIVEFSSRNNPVLGLVVGRDGKKNWFIADTRCATDTALQLHAAGYANLRLCPGGACGGMSRWPVLQGPPELRETAAGASGGGGRR